MEVWALEAHRARHILQEMLTIKADDVIGRAKAFEAIVKGTDIPTPKVPESFKVLIKELQSLGLNVVPVGATVYNEVSENKDAAVAEEVKQEVEALKETLNVEAVVEETPTDGVEIAEVGPEVESPEAVSAEGAENE
jgi:DNA-directed RNA polymerase subunit beta